MEAKKTPLWGSSVKKTRMKERRKQANITSERKRVANREIFGLIGTEMKAGPHHGADSQAHKVW